MDYCVFISCKKYGNISDDVLVFYTLKRYKDEIIKVDNHKLVIISKLQYENISNNVRYKDVNFDRTELDQIVDKFANQYVTLKRYTYLLWKSLPELGFFREMKYALSFSSSELRKYRWH